MVTSLGWLSPATSRGLPAARTTRAGSRCLLGLAPTGGYRAAHVARRAVGSYPTFSPLPLDKGRSVFCGPFRRLAAPRRYLAVCPLELGLSSARHSDRRTATITPYRLPGERYRSRKGRGKPQRASRLNRRTRLAAGRAGRSTCAGRARTNPPATGEGGTRSKRRAAGGECGPGAYRPAPRLRPGGPDSRAATGLLLAASRSGLRTAVSQERRRDAP